MATITILKTPTLKDPKWDKTDAKPGDKLELSVTAESLSGQAVGFEIRNPAKQVLAVLDADKSQKAKWTAPLVPDDAQYSFFALLREKPSPANGQLGVLQRIESTNKVKVKGTKLTISSVDAAFVPKQEKLEVKYKIEGEAPAKGRIEIWGERYPTNKPIYAEAFTPTAGEKTWKTWYGGLKPSGTSDDLDDPPEKGKITENGPLKGKYLTPEFSPYRVRIIIGPDDTDKPVEDPCGKGLGKVAMAEAQSEVTFQSVRIRLQAGLTEAAADDKYKLKQVLRIRKNIEDATNANPIVVKVTDHGLATGDSVSIVGVKGNTAANGTFAVTVVDENNFSLNGSNGSGAYTANTGRMEIMRRFPRSTETCRIRIPCVRHTVNGEALNQAGANVADGYMSANANPPGGAGQTKYQIDSAIYTRPEIPLEIEPRLRSRVAGNNTDVTKLGLFEKEAVGPAVFEMNVDEVFQSELYSTAGTAESRAYFLNASTRVKRGADDAPENDGTNPVFDHWVARIKVQNDGDQDFDVSPAYSAGAPENLTDAAFAWTANKAKDELTVYLNRTKLEAAATNDEFDKGHKDFKEVNTTTIKLRKGLTRKDDLLWIARADPAAPVKTADWHNFPLGLNCHTHYGGIRGKASSAELAGTLRSDFSSAKTTSEPIIGLRAGTDAFPYKDYINLDPQKAGALCETVESQAMTATGAQQGLAGIIFSPSTVAGDGCEIVAELCACPYARSFGFVTVRPATASITVRGKTGRLIVWRLLTISESYLGGGVVDPALKDRDDPGEGTGMKVVRLNKLCEGAFNEWIVPPQVQNGDPHRAIVKADYRAAINALTGTGDGKVTLNNDTDVNNEFVRWDHYRVRLPPNIPDDATDAALQRVNAVSNAIVYRAGPPTKGLAPGTAATAAMASADAAITAAGILGTDNDPALEAGVAAAIPIFAGSPDDYESWVDGEIDKLTYQLLDRLIPRVNPPTSMKAIRWPYGYQEFWNDGTPGAMASTRLTTAGEVRGSAQSYYYTIGGNPDTFEHEMGHSVHLAHFLAGNFAWKHHDFNYPQCIMSYYNKNKSVPQPGGTVGTWPVDLALTNRDQFCAKCMLKMRGWKENVLPFHWSHPDLF